MSNKTRLNRAILDIMEVMHDKARMKELERNSEDEFSPENTLTETEEPGTFSYPLKICNQ